MRVRGRVRALWIERYIPLLLQKKPGPFLGMVTVLCGPTSGVFSKAWSPAFCPARSVDWGGGLVLVVLVVVVGGGV